MYEWHLKPLTLKRKKLNYTLKCIASNSVILDNHISSTKFWKHRDNLRISDLILQHVYLLIFVWIEVICRNSDDLNNFISDFLIDTMEAFIAPITTVINIGPYYFQHLPIQSKYEKKIVLLYFLILVTLFIPKNGQWLQKILNGSEARLVP